MTDKLQVSNIFVAVFQKSSLDQVLSLYDANSTFLSLKPGFEPRFWGTDGTIDYVKSKGFVGESVVRGFEYGGRVKSLDRANFARILADRNNPKHIEELRRELSVIASKARQSKAKIASPSVCDDRDWEPIDLVIVDLYAPNESTFPESMDIGGQALIRAAIKNYQNIALAFDQESIGALVTELKDNNGSTTLEFRKVAAKKAARFIAERTKLEADLFDKVKLQV